MNQVIPWNLIEEEEKKMFKYLPIVGAMELPICEGKRKDVTELHKYTTFLSNKPPLDLLSLHILT